MSPDEADMTSVSSFIKNPVHCLLCCNRIFCVSSILTIFCFYLYQLRVPPEASIMAGGGGAGGPVPPMFQVEGPNC